jgi:large subunit ribosomal protein L4
MVKVDIIDLQRKKVSEMEVDDRLLNHPENPDLVYDAVRRLLAARRRGTAQTKERSLISGGGKKPWRQKGTGRARSGSTRSPVWRGGGTIFGPHPRDYAFSLPKKVRQAALRSVVSQKFRENKMVVLDALDLAEPKTRKFVDALKGLEIRSALVVIDGAHLGIERSARNVPQIQVTQCAGLNVHDILRHEYLVFLRSSLEAMERNLEK